MIYFLIILFFSSLEDMLIDFGDRGRKGEREGEKYEYKRETLIGCFSYVPQLGTEPTT